MKTITTVATYTLPKRITDRKPYEGYTNIYTFNLLQAFDNESSLYEAKMKWIERLIRRKIYKITAGGAIHFAKSCLYYHHRRDWEIVYKQTDWKEVTESFQEDIDNTLSALRKNFHNCDHCGKMTVEHPQVIRRYPIDPSVHANAYLCYHCAYVEFNVSNHMWDSLSTVHTEITEQDYNPQPTIE